MLVSTPCIIRSSYSEIQYLCNVLILITMRTLLFISTFYIFGSFTLPTDSDYYCDSKGGKRYHQSKQCSGLQKCTHTIKSTTTAEASKIGLTQCLLEK